MQSAELRLCTATSHQLHAPESAALVAVEALHVNEQQHSVGGHNGPIARVFRWPVEGSLQAVDKIAALRA